MPTPAPSAASVASREYADLIDAYVLDDADAADAAAVGCLGVEALVAPIIDVTRGDVLVATLLSLA